MSHNQAKVSLLKAREAELTRLMNALTPPRQTKNSSTTNSIYSSTAPRTTTTTSSSTTTTTSTTPSNPTNPSTQTEPPSTTHSPPSHPSRHRLRTKPNQQPSSNTNSVQTARPQHQTRHQTRHQNNDNERKLRHAFRVSQRDTSIPIHNTKSEKIKFVRAHERVLQGQETKIVLPSHPILQLHRAKASTRENPTIVPIQLLNPALFQKKPVPIPTRSRGSQTKPLPKPPATVAIEIQTEFIPEPVQRKEDIAEEVIVETIKETMPEKKVVEEEHKESIDIVEEEPSQVRVNIPAPPKQLEEWELKELGPL